MRLFYKYDETKRTARKLKGVSKNDNASVRYRFVDDDDKDDEILLNRWYLKKIEGMKSIRLYKHVLKRF